MKSALEILAGALAKQDAPHQELRLALGVIDSVRYYLAQENVAAQVEDILVNDVHHYVSLHDIRAVLWAVTGLDLYRSV